MPELVRAVAGSLRDGGTGRTGARRPRGARRGSPASSCSSRASAGAAGALHDARAARGRARRRSSLRSPAAARMRRAPTRRPCRRALMQSAPAHRRAARARPRGRPATRPGRLRRRRRRRRQDTALRVARRGLPRDRASRCSARRRAAAPPTSSPPSPASEARTLHRLLLDAATRRRPAHGCVLVVDEAGMADTRVLAPLLELVDQARTARRSWSVTPASFPPSAPAGSTPALCERLGALSLTENRRQRDAVRADRARPPARGDPESYLAHAAQRGRLHLDDDALAAKQRLLEDWWQAAEHDLAGTVMLAHRRDDVRDLNDAARTLTAPRRPTRPRRARSSGSASSASATASVCRRNDPTLGVRNGTRATIVELDSCGAHPAHDRRRRSARFPLDYAADHLEHGYALTGHAAQGATVERAFVLLQRRGRASGNGATSPAPARERKPASTSPPQRASANCTDTSQTGPTPHSGSAARSHSPPPSRSRSSRRASPSDATARLFAQRQQRLDQARAQAQERLAAAEAKLEALGWRRHGRRGTQLRADIALHRAALRLADESHTELRPAAPVPPRVRPPLDHDLAPSRTRSLSREREAPGLDLGR